MTLTFSNHSEDLPYITLMVHGQPQMFLLDSGAGATSMSSAHYEGPISNQVVNSVGISGTDIACPVTPLLERRTFFMNLQLYQELQLIYWDVI